MNPLGVIDNEIESCLQKVSELRARRFKIFEEEYEQNKKKKAALHSERAMKRIHDVLQRSTYRDMASKIRDAGSSMELTAEDEGHGLGYMLQGKFASGDFYFEVGLEVSVDEDGRDSFARFEVSNPRRMHLHPLSSVSQAGWRDLATKCNLPEELRQVARFTEFFLGLFACNITEDCLDNVYPDLLDTEERDGEAYYTGHGGGMKRVFDIQFKNDKD